MQDNAPETSEVAIIARMEIQRALGRVEGKLDQIMNGMNNHETRDAERFAEIHIEVDKFNNRISSLERKVWYAGGVVGAIVFTISHFPFSTFWK